MSISTVIVALNSQTLRKYEPEVTQILEKQAPKEPHGHAQMDNM